MKTNIWTGVAICLAIAMVTVSIILPVNIYKEKTFCEKGFDIQHKYNSNLKFYGEKLVDKSLLTGEPICQKVVVCDIR